METKIQKVYRMDDVNGRSSDLVRPVFQSGSDRYLNEDRRSKNLVQINLNRDEKMFSPLGIRLNNGLVSPAVKQSMSLEKKNTRYSVQQRQQTLMFGNANG